MTSDHLPLAMAPLAAWGVGVVVGALALVVGVLCLKALARARVPWWPALVAPAFAFGPAIALLVGAFLVTGDVASLLFWDDACRPTARTGWSLLVFFGATGVYGLVSSFLTSRIVTEELGLKIPQVFIDLGRYVLWLVMAFVVVGGIWRRHDLFSALFTAGAVTTAILALALQDTIKNFISAWAIVGEGVYAIGDWVWLGEDEGEVIAVTRRTTKIRTRQGDVVTVPNGQVTATKVRNQSRPTREHAEFVAVQASYEAPPNRVRDVLRRAVLEVPKILQTPAPVFRVRGFTDAGVEYQVKVWVDDLANVHDILSDLRVQIWYHFQRAGIEFPYPVRELRRLARHEEDADARARAVLARLRSVPFFEALPEDVLTALARDAGVVGYGAGERVVLAGDPGDTCYVVDAGRLAVLVSDGKAERQVATLEAGALFGEMSLLTGEPRTATVRALDDARLVSVGAASLRAALERAPELAQRLAEAAALRREGLLEARAALDAAARSRVDAQAHRLRELIKRFFRLPEAPSRAPAPPGDAAGASGDGDRVAGRAPSP